MSEDTISRQEVIDTVHKIILGFFSEKDGVMTDMEKTLLSVSKAVCNGVRELPPAQPYTDKEIQAIMSEEELKENGIVIHKDAEIPHEPHIPFETLQNACKYRRTYHEIEGYFKKRDVCYNKKNAAECNSECPLLKSYEEVDA